MFTRLGYLLKTKSIPQELFARRLNVSPATISRWCGNVSQPSLEMTYRIAAELEIDMDELFYTIPVTINSKDNNVNLSELGTSDAFLRAILGKTDLEAIQGSYLRIERDFGINSKRSYPLSLIQFVDLQQNPKIPMIEIGIIIQHCQYTTISIHNCKEDIGFMFFCPGNHAVSK